jgi:NADPH2:quinone reductase
MVRWANHLGASVIGIVGSDAKAAIAAGAGAHHVIVGRDADVVGAVAELTGGRGVDVAYDGVGGTGLARTLGCVRPFGIVASIGQAAGPIPPLDVEQLGPRRSLLLARPSVMAYMNVTDHYLTAANTVLSLIAEGVLVAAGTRYPLKDAARAHCDLEAGRTSGSLYLLP